MSRLICFGIFTSKGFVGIYLSMVINSELPRQADNLQSMSCQRKFHVMTRQWLKYNIKPKGAILYTESHKLKVKNDRNPFLSFVFHDDRP